MNAVKIKFKNAGKIYFFNPQDLELKDQDAVVVETIRGIELGYVVGNIFDVDVKDLIAELKPVIRVATPTDLKNYEENNKNQEEILSKCKKYIIKNKLDMKLVSSEYTLDKTKLIIQFEAEERVDFRTLVKDLAEEFRVRIELRQIGSRDSAKIIGGLGPCGLVMCCNSFLNEFDNVSIKMAKNQNLSLNPQKISGTCGKLYCCLKYEDEVYKEMRVNFPDVGDSISLADGNGKVLSSDVINGMLKLKYYDDDRIAIVNITDVKSFKRRKSAEIILNDRYVENNGSN